jgi:hypothetical protein
LQAFQKVRSPALLERRGYFFEMWMSNKNGGECPAENESLTETQPTLRHVYDFILQAVKGEGAAADAIFEDYLAGKLSEELLSISRRCVSADRAGSSDREIEEGSGGIESGAGISENALSTALS